MIGNSLLCWPNGVFASSEFMQFFKGHLLSGVRTADVPLDEEVLEPLERRPKFFDPRSVAGNSQKIFRIRGE